MSKSKGKSQTNSTLNASARSLRTVRRAKAVRVADPEQFRAESDNPAAIQAKMDEVAAQPEATGLAETTDQIKSETKARTKKRAKKVVADEKSAAANPKTEVVLTKKAISARGEGVRLYSLAGRPKRTEFIKVFGQIRIDPADLIGFYLARYTR